MVVTAPAEGDSQGEDLRVIGQLAAGYILIEEPESLWVVDQHVAHERAILDEVTLNHIVTGELPDRVRELTNDPRSWA